MHVRELEESLLRVFPPSQAEAWDRTGMLVGNPDERVSGVAVALDPTIASLEFARAHGANVLVTHHPIFLDPPQSVKPLGTGGDAVGGRIWHAVRSGVSVMSFHTALDASPLAARVLSEPLGLEPDGLLEPFGGSDAGPGAGYGRICDAGGISLGELAQRCRVAFGRQARVWGDAADALSRVCLWTGAAGTCPRECIARGIDTLVCGEVKYHEALDAAELGLRIIELGHDVSEQVHCGVLVESVVKAGVSRELVFMRGLPENWS